MPKPSDPYRMAHNRDDYERCARLAEIEAWERERRRALIREYLKAAVQIVAIFCFTAFMVWLVVSAANEAMG